MLTSIRRPSNASLSRSKSRKPKACHPGKMRRWLGVPVLQIARLASAADQVDTGKSPDGLRMGAIAAGKQSHGAVNATAKTDEDRNPLLATTRTVCVRRYAAFLVGQLQDGREVARSHLELALPGNDLHARVVQLRQWDVDVVICGAVYRELEIDLQGAGFVTSSSFRSPRNSSASRPPSTKISLVFWFLGNKNCY
jgi:hypothetical protein